MTASKKAADEDVAALKSSIAEYQGIESALLRLITDTDIWALKLDFYAAVVFSNLFRDPSKDTAYFSKSRPFLQLELRQLTSTWQDITVWGDLALQTTSFQTASDNSVKPIDSFTFEAGLEGRIWQFSEPLVLNLVAGLGAAGFSATDTSGEGLAKHPTDSFPGRGRVGLRLRQMSGIWEGTFSELAYFRDPTFVKPNRVLVRGRIVVSPQTGEGRGLGAYVEVALNRGGGARDEARLSVGIRLDTLAVLRAIVGAGPH